MVLKQGNGKTGLQITVVSSVWRTAVHKTVPFLADWGWLEYFRNLTLFVEPDRSFISFFSIFQGFQSSMFINFAFLPRMLYVPTVEFSFDLITLKLLITGQM
jgi:hypothetical protein